jgi:hypothetical protein
MIEIKFKKPLFCYVMKKIGIPIAFVNEITWHIYRSKRYRYYRKCWCHLGYSVL